MKFSSREQRRAVFAALGERNKFSREGIPGLGDALTGSIIGAWPGGESGADRSISEGLLGVWPDKPKNENDDVLLRPLPAQFDHAINDKFGEAELYRNMANKVEPVDANKLVSMAEQEEWGMDELQEMAPRYKGSALPEHLRTDAAVEQVRPEVLQHDSIEPLVMRQGVGVQPAVPDQVVPVVEKFTKDAGGGFEHLHGDELPSEISEGTLKTYGTDFSKDASGLNEDEMNASEFYDIEPDDLMSRKDSKKAGEGLSPLITRDEFKDNWVKLVGKPEEDPKDFNTMIKDFYSDYITSASVSSEDYIRRLSVPSDSEIPMNFLKTEKKGRIPDNRLDDVRELVDVFEVDSGYVFVGKPTNIDKAERFVR